MRFTTATFTALVAFATLAIAHPAVEVSRQRGLHRVKSPI